MKLFNQNDILCVGCGNHPEGTVNIDIDISQQTRLSPDNVPLNPQKISNLIQASTCYLPFKNNSFIQVISTYCLEHIENPIQALKEFIRVCSHSITLLIPHRLDKRNNPKYNLNHKQAFNKKWFQYVCDKLNVYHSSKIVEYRYFPSNLIPLIRLPSILQVVIFCQNV